MSSPAPSGERSSEPRTSSSRGMNLLAIVLLIVLGGMTVYLVQVDGRTAELRSMEARLEARMDRLERGLLRSIGTASSTVPLEIP